MTNTRRPGLSTILTMALCAGSLILTGLFVVIIEWTLADELTTTAGHSLAERARRAAGQLAASGSLTQEDGTTQLLAIDATGVIVSGPGKLAGKRVDMASWRLAPGGYGVLEQQWDGRTYLVGYARVKAIGRQAGPAWTVLARQEAGEVAGAIARLKRKAGLAGAAAALLFSLLGWLAARRITGSLLRAANEARMIEQGKPGSIMTVRQNYSELHTLTSAFDSLLCKLAAKEAALNDTNAALELRILQRTMALETSLLQTTTSEARVRSILDTAHDAFVGMDTEGVIVEWNRQAERMFGWMRDEAVGTPLHETIVPLSMRAAHSAGLKHFLFTGSARVMNKRLQLTATRRDGTEFPCELTIGHVRVGEEQFFGAFINDVSERRRVEKELAAERALLTAVLETMDIAVVACDSHGVLTLFNRASRQLHGIPMEEFDHALAGKHYTPFASDGVTPMQFEDLPLVRALSGKQVQNQEMVIRPTGQRARQVLASGRQLVDLAGELLGAVAVITDVTERIESERFLRAVTNQSPAIIGYIDQDQVYRFANATYRTMLGLDPATMIGRHMRDVMGAAVYGLLQPHIEAALSGNRVHFEPEMSVLHGPVHLMTDYIPDIGDDGVVKGVHIMVTDITERKNAELSQARSEQLAAASSQAKTEFVANMSHEIRTPMNAVLGMTQLLARTPLAAEQRGYLSMIQASGQALMHVIDDVLDFSKIEAGRTDIAALPFTLRDVLDVVGTTMVSHATEKDLQLALVVHDDVPASLVGDAMHLQQALLNLAGNAVKFTARGKVSVTVELATRDSCSATLRFIVSDTGIGMTREQLDRMFTPFEQADTSTSRRFGGTGLGLAISRKLIELMGGSIAVDSQIGVGSTFVVTIALGVDAAAAGSGMAGNLPDDDNAPAAPDALVQPSAGPLDGVRILVAEDNLLNQVVARGMLESSGAFVQIAENGQEAVDMLRRDASFDIVLLDVQMPVMDGYAATRAMRDELRAHIPILAMSAGVMGEEKRRCIELGMDGFIAKPVDMAHMIATIAAFLGREQSAPPPVATDSRFLADVFDVTPLIKLSANNPEQRNAFIALIIKTGQQAPLDLARAGVALAQGRIDDCAKLLHSVRGSVGTLGARRYAAASLRLEENLKRASGRELVALLAVAEAEMAATRTALEGWIEHYQSGAPALQ